jgi:hypothetical protein
MPADNDVYTEDGRWKLSHWSSPEGGSIRLTHASTGQVVLDLTDDAINVESWEFSKDQSLLFLRVSRRDRRVMTMPITLELETGWYYHHPDPRQAYGPQGDAGDLVESLITAVPPPGRNKHTYVPRWIEPGKLDRPGTHVKNLTSPDGRFLIDLNRNAQRFAVVIHPVKIVEIATGDTLLDLWDTMCDTRAEFEAETGRLLLTITRYPETEASIFLAIDLDQEIYWEPPKAKRARGYLDELQRRLGIDSSNMHPRADWFPTVRASRRDNPRGKTPAVANPMRWASSDGNWALYLDEFEIGPGLRLRQARIEDARSEQCALDLRGSDWACDGEFLEGCNQLKLTIADRAHEKWLRVKIDLDCKLYWEEAGTLLGRPGGVQAGMLSELQSRFCATLKQQSRLKIVISTPLARNPEQPQAVLAEDMVREIVVAHAGHVYSAGARAAELLSRAEGLGLARDVVMALRVAREVCEGRLTPEQGAAELARWSNAAKTEP